MHYCIVYFINNFHATDQYFLVTLTGTVDGGWMGGVDGGVASGGSGGSGKFVVCGGS